MWKSEELKRTQGCFVASLQNVMDKSEWPLGTISENEEPVPEAGKAQKGALLKKEKQVKKVQGSVVFSQAQKVPGSE